VGRGRKRKTTKTDKMMINTFIAVIFNVETG